jgi:hypothetical protein
MRCRHWHAKILRQLERLIPEDFWPARKLAQVADRYECIRGYPLSFGWCV